MTKITAPNGDVFEAERSTDLLDVTSISRPDTSWRYVDRAGHEHRWHVDGRPAEGYDPSKSHDVPTLERVEDEPIYIDGDEVSQSHRECRICRETVRPGCCPDTHQQFVAGIRRVSYAINGEHVDEKTFKERVEAAFGVKL